MGSEQDDILDPSLIPFDGDFNQQVDNLLARVRLTRDEVEKIKYLLDDLTRAFSYSWRGTIVHPFGSVVTGLGIKTSDIDCYIQPPSSYPVLGAIKHAKNVLNRNMSKFTQVFAIFTAKVPIVKFVHVPTGFSGDINFSGVNGVRNSKLIAFLLGLDPRALPLAVMVKYWSKVYNFTGTNLMASYALTLMVIFYLQVKSVLPSVAELQRHQQYQWVDCWNTAFNDDFTYITDNEESLYELLGGFFDYYNSFDFAELIISPYLGYPVKKELMRDSNNLPAAYDLYKENVVLREECSGIKLDTPVCIQDPFDHSRNCSAAVFAKLFNKILALFELASKTFHEILCCDDFLRELFTMNLISRASMIPRKLKPYLAFHRKRGKNENSKQYKRKMARTCYAMQFEKHKSFNGKNK